jgi:hypothetical protein
MREVLRSSDHPLQILNQLLRDVLQLASYPVCVLDTQFFSVYNPMTDHFHHFQKPDLCLNMGTATELMESLKEGLEKSRNALVFEETEITVEQVEVKEEKKLVLLDEVIEVVVQNVLGQVDPVWPQVELHFHHLRTPVESLQNLTWVELAVH